MQTLLQQLTTIREQIPILAPECILLTFFLLIILVDLIGKKNTNKNLISKLAFVCFLLVFILAIFQIRQIKDLTLSAGENGYDSKRFFGFIRYDSFAVFFKLVFALAGMLAVLMSAGYNTLEKRSKGLGEFHAVLIAVVFGMNFMAMSSNLLMMFLSLEMVSIGSYILTAYTRMDHKSAEGGLKYILFGTVASGAMIYGISLLYGFTGTLDISDPVFLERLGAVNETAILVAGLFTLSGFAYKIAMVPFHLWSPDVYEGAPTPVTAFMSVGPKAAGFAMLLRFLLVFVEQKGVSYNGWAHFNWINTLSILSILTMTIGNFSAIWQTNAKRMLAYSSIAHAGYLLMGVMAISTIGISSILFYLIVYTLMNVGAFLVIGIISEKIGSEDVRDFKGLGMKMPFLGSCLVVFLISLTGLPPTAGFTGKLFLFSAVLDAYYVTHNSFLFWLMIAGILNSVVSLFYYFKIPLFMFLKKGSENLNITTRYTEFAFAGALAVALIFLFIRSGFLMDLAGEAVLGF
ncbi:MAG: hypothetical protein A3H98_11990 [Bacteroidetes bacterium RIFCSPLOWO2_02_FULL_36_8]|nr:MAG: hypothetical protein A3H98_11990 [Bacteroidetes bacterium RIFCSPLOWO2_02_FULL_36_8]OFY69564.1 MAG: hypothetical protein A3G23_11040 [Bacteroidetes bacterium RIFCSPLOWO2_12_FULL_37_12]